MRTNGTIGFATTPVKGTTAEGKILYQGQLRHNRTLSVAETRKLFAEYTQSREPLTNMYLDMMESFMKEYLAKGYRLNFGPFAAGFKMGGSLPSADAPFDARKNTLSVELQPSGRVRKAVNGLKIVNETDIAFSSISTNYMLTPYEAPDVITSEGEREILTNGRHIWVHPLAEGEGVWIENDLEEKLLEGTVTKADACRLNVTFTDPIAPGVYWYVVGSRDISGGELLLARRRITAV